MQHKDAEGTSTLPKFAFIAFDWQKASYAVEIESVLEVVESRPIAPYPVWKKGHLGIVNIRGQVLPVVHLITGTDITCCTQAKGKPHCHPKQILVLSHPEFGPFGLAAECAHKIIISGLKEQLEGKTIRVGQKPIKILMASDLELFKEHHTAQGA